MGFTQPSEMHSEPSLQLPLHMQDVPTALLLGLQTDE